MTILDRHNVYDDPISAWGIQPGHVTSYVADPMWQRFNPVHFTHLNRPSPTFMLMFPINSVSATWAKSKLHGPNPMFSACLFYISRPFYSPIIFYSQLFYNPFIFQFWPFGQWVPIVRLFYSGSKLSGYYRQWFPIFSSSHLYGFDFFSTSN